VTKKILVILISLALTQGVMGLCFTEDVKGITRGETATKEGKDTGSTAGGAKYHAQGLCQFIRLTGPSSEKVTLPPPCSVIGIKGKYIILKDFYGEEKTIEVEEFTPIKVGDKVVVKDGMLIIGNSPK
jgi:hypothetical protein